MVENYISGLFTSQEYFIYSVSFTMIPVIIITVLTIHTIIKKNHRRLMWGSGFFFIFGLFSFALQQGMLNTFLSMDLDYNNVIIAYGSVLKTGIYFLISILYALLSIIFLLEKNVRLK